MRVLLLLALATFASSSTSTDDLVVQTSYGWIRGYEAHAADLTRVKIFKNVPFAAPPVGNLRWKMPQPPVYWEGVRDGTKYSAACMSNSTVSSSPQENVSEDCLYLNIFMAGSCTPTNPCPIVVYLHGGGMNYDSAVYLDDAHLVSTFAAKGIMLVIPAFRLGFTGIMDLGDNQTLIPHNLGVHDVLSAMRYIVKDAHRFGGDNKRISLFGHSFGGTLALVLAFSPLRIKDIPITRIVAMSPGMRFVHQSQMREMSAHFVTKAGCGGLSMNDTYDCLMAKDGMYLLGVQRALEEEDPQHSSLSGITMTAPLFPFKDYQDLLSRPPKLDLLTGSTIGEMDFVRNPMKETRIGELIGAKNIEELDEFYLGLQEAGKEKQIHESETQSIYIGVYLFAKSIARSGQVYLYDFDQPTHNRHTDDLSYLMGIHGFERDANEKVITTFYPDLFVNFTLTGSPSPRWLPLDKRDSYYSIKVDLEKRRMPEMRLWYQKDTVDFWIKKAPRIDKLITIAKTGGGKLKWSSDKRWRDLDIDMDTLSNDEASLIDYHPTFQAMVVIMIVFVFIFGFGLVLGRLWHMASSTADPSRVLIVGHDGRPVRIDAEKVPLMTEQIF